MSKSKGSKITVVVLGVVVIFLILYDLFALYFWGVETTISVVLNEWSYKSHPLLCFCLGMIFGGLVVHFFRWKP